jgi:hypothetical protein
MPSNQTKQKWNAVHYTQVKVSVKPEVAKAFKEACVVNGVSQAAVLSDFMIKYANLPSTPASSAKDTFDSRKKRRAALKNLPHH